MIGIFDSGYGGLTVWKEIVKTLPQYDYLYLGDNSRAPYGGHTEETVYEYTKEAVDFLFKKGCTLVILACNTASSMALRRLQQEWLPNTYPERRILGVLRPVCEAVSEQNFQGVVGVLATKGTVHSGAYTKELEKLAPHLVVKEKAAPLLVPLIEEGWIGKPETNRILRTYLRSFKDMQVRTLILGCTHYPLLQKDIARIMGKQCRIVRSAEAVAEKLAQYLVRHPEREGRLTKEGKRLFCTTEDAHIFAEKATKFLDGKKIQGEKVRLSHLEG
jgi:glutamate racemase